MKPLISVIVPLYKVEKYIDQCCQSLLAQSFKNYEVIFIDDFSPDTSGEKLASYLQQYSHFSYHRLEKKSGTLAARIEGVKRAQGDYILLLDPDDTLNPQALKEIAKKISIYNPDLLQYKVKVYEGGKYVWDIFFPSGYLEGNQVFELFFVKHSCMIWLAGGKVFRRELFLKTASYFEYLPRLYYGEDFAFTYISSYLAKSFCSVPKAVYHYFKTSSSVTASTISSSSQFLTWAENVKEIENILQQFKQEQGINEKYPHIINESLHHFWLVQYFFSNLIFSLRLLHFKDMCLAVGIAETFDILKNHHKVENLLPYPPKASIKQPKPIKTIAFIGEKLRGGGVERVSSILMPILQNLGYQVVFLSKEQPSKQDFPIPSSILRIVLEEEKRYLSIEKAVQQYQIDAVILQDYWDTTISLDLLYFAVREDIWVINSLHNMPLWAEHSCPAERETFCSFYQYADVMTVLSRRDKVYLEGKKTCPPIAYMPNLKAFTEIKTVSLKQANILFIGHLIPVKNPLLLINAFAQVKEECPEAELIFAGTGYLMQDCQALVKTLGLENSVQFKGYVSNVSSLLNEASVLAMPSIFEGFGLAPLETLAHGVPVVLSRMEYLEIASLPGVTLFEKEDPGDLAQKIIDLLKDEEFRKAQGEAAYESAKLFDNEAIALRWKTLLDDLVQGRIQESTLIKEDYSLKDEEISELYEQERRYLISHHQEIFYPNDDTFISHGKIKIWLKKMLKKVGSFAKKVPLVRKIFIKIKNIINDI